MPAAQAQTRGANYVVKAPNFGSNVVPAMAGLYVLVVGAAIEDYVAFQGSVASR